MKNTLCLHRGESGLLWKGPTFCCLVCILCHNYWTNYDLRPAQNDRQNFNFVKDTSVDGKKLATNCQKMATYYAASFLPHYRRVLFSHLLAFNLCMSQLQDCFQCENSQTFGKKRPYLNSYKWCAKCIISQTRYIFC